MANSFLPTREEKVSLVLTVESREKLEGGQRVRTICPVEPDRALQKTGGAEMVRPFNFSGE